jgi:uncharacterized integral membrane protein
MEAIWSATATSPLLAILLAVLVDVLINTTGGTINCFIVEISSPLLTLLCASGAGRAPLVAFVFAAKWV